MIESQKRIFAYGALAATQSMTDSSSEDAIGATESHLQPNGTNPDNVSFTSKVTRNGKRPQLNQVSVATL